MPIRVQGWDISLNHGAFVELWDGQLADFWFVTDKIACLKKGKKRASKISFSDSDDCSESNTKRLKWWKDYLESHLFKSPEYVGIEDYILSTGKHVSRSYQIGELGGLARLMAFEAGPKVRLHEPMTVKMFTAHDGHAEKDVMRKVVKERWGADFDEFDTGEGSHQTSEDLADAFAIAQMVLTEIKLRSGEIKINSLHEKEQHVFNRETKMHKVSLLNRGWLWKGE